MKTIAAAAIVVFGLSCLFASGSANRQPDDPCQNKGSNAETRNCYGHEQTLANAEADALATKIAAALRQDAQDPDHGAVINDLMRKSASAVLRSQESWRKSRDEYCSAVEFSWTTGSGAGTAYEGCMLNLGQRRVHDLRLDFNGYLPNSTDHNPR